MSINTKKLAARMQAVKNSASVLNKLAYSASIPVNYIHCSTDNLCARQDTDESIADLAASIDANGLLHPLTVNKVSETEYKIISGERRFRAITTYLHWDVIDCRVFEHIDGPKSFLMLLSANLAVREYTAGEKLSFYKAAVTALAQMDAPATQKDLAKVLGVSDRQIKKYKAIASLPEKDQEAIQNGTLSINEAYAKATGKGEPVPLTSAVPEGEPVPLTSAVPEGEPVPSPYQIKSFPVAQIQLPAPADTDPHPRLQFDGHGVHAGDSFAAWLPDGWHEITLEINWDATGPNCWIISDPALRGVCPVGLWCRVDKKAL